MKKIRPIRKFGNSIGIKLDWTDLKDMDWKEGDWLDITNSIKINKKVNKDGKN